MTNLTEIIADGEAPKLEDVSSEADIILDLEKSRKIHFFRPFAWKRPSNSWTILCGFTVNF